nr:hypothetical protein [Chitinimonas sp. BJB300]
MSPWVWRLVIAFFAMNVCLLYRNAGDLGRSMARETALAEYADTLEADKVELKEQLSAVVALSKRLQALEANRQALTDTLKTLAAQRAQYYERLEHENAAVRAWGAEPLPADVARLRERPAFVSAAAYREWLSTPDAVPVASEPSQAEPGLVAAD